MAGNAPIPGSVPEKVTPDHQEQQAAGEAAGEAAGGAAGGAAAGAAAEGAAAGGGMEVVDQEGGEGGRQPKRMRRAPPA
jgi:hypothetical protein